MVPGEGEPTTADYGSCLNAKDESRGALDRQCRLNLWADYHPWWRRRRRTPPSVMLVRQNYPHFEAPETSDPRTSVLVPAMVMNKARHNFTSSRVISSEKTMTREAVGDEQVSL